MIRQFVGRALYRYAPEAYFLIGELTGGVPETAQPGKQYAGWLRELGQSPEPGAATSSRRILLFACTPWWAEMMLALAVVMVGRGHQVTFAYLPYYNTQKSFGSGDESAEQRRLRVTFWRHLRRSAHPRLRTVDLSASPRAPLPAWAQNEVRLQSLDDTRYVLRLDAANIDGSPEHRKVFDFRLERNSVCASALMQLLDSMPQDSVLVPNGRVLEFAIVHAIASGLGLPAVSFEFFERKGHIMAATGKPVIDLDLSEAWDREVPHTLSAEQRQRVEALIRIREGASWEGFRRAMQRAPKGGGRDVCTRLGLKADLPTALLCTHYASEPILRNAYVLFGSMSGWVKATMQFFAAHPSLQLVVRAHPVEAVLGTGRPTAEIISEALPSLPPNIRFVAPGDNVNTYDLMEVSSLGLVNSGTPGLEMALRGIPVVSIAPSHYYYLTKGFTIEPKSVPQYFQAIERILADPAGNRLTAGQKDLAWAFTDCYYHRWGHPFPWFLGTFQKDIKEYPVKRLLSDEGASRFGATLKYLAREEA